MAGNRTTWRQKLADRKGLPKTQPLSGRMLSHYGPGSMVIPAPHEVDAVMRDVPRGGIITIPEIRQELAERHRATLACPLTTGIFAWIAAHAAAEAEAAGESEITPYWRTLKAGGELNPRYPGGIPDQRRRLESEGRRIIQRGSRFFVDPD